MKGSGIVNVRVAAASCLEQTRDGHGEQQPPRQRSGQGSARKGSTERVDGNGGATASLFKTPLMSPTSIESSGSERDLYGEGELSEEG